MNENNEQLENAIQQNTEAIQEIQNFLEEQKAEEEEQEQADAEQEQADAEQETEEQQTQAEIIQGISDNLYLNNCINIGLLFFIGVIFGTILIKIFWDRFKK